MSKNDDVNENERASFVAKESEEAPEQRTRTVTDKPGQSQRTKSVMDKQKPPDQRARTVTVAEKRGMRGSLSEASKLAAAGELADKDIRLGRAFWKQNIDHQQSAYSMALFRELFLTYPETEFFFLRMRDTGTDTSDVFTSAQFRSHMSDRVVPKLKEVLENLDKPEELREAMTKLGLYHAKLHLRKRHMDDMRKVILASARRLAGNRMLKEEEAALDRCFAKAFLIAQETMDEYRRQHPKLFGRYS